MENLITIDGPSGVGKGTLAISLAKRLHWHYLNIENLTKLTNNLKIDFKITNNEDLIVTLDDKNVTNIIQTEECAKKASIIASNKVIRKSLVQTQRMFYKKPGLVAEGRDMGSVIFQEAEFKFFLQASNKIRAERRHKQLKLKGINVSLSRLISELNKRDKRDLSRKSSPLIIPNGAVVINTDNLSINEVIEQVVKHCKKLFETKN